jgi:hypothetical protein
MPFARKVLWIVDFDANPNLFLGYIKKSGCDTVCIRTWSNKLVDAIPTFHADGKTVWAWRWPCAAPDTKKKHGPHVYAPDEAKFVAQQLIPAGLDGYIVDPESNDDKDPNDWNRTSVDDPVHPGHPIALSKIAADFCSTIKTAAVGRPFHFGITSGCAFPGPGQKTLLPWAAFISPSVSVYPQTYWRWHNDDGKITEINDGTPESAISLATPAWKPVAQGKPIIPMSGEVNLITADEVTAYGAALANLNVAEAHFYIDEPPVQPDVLTAIKAL